MPDLATRGEKAMGAKPDIDQVLVPEFAEKRAGYFENYVASIRPPQPELGGADKVIAAHNRRERP